MRYYESKCQLFLFPWGDSLGEGVVDGSADGPWQGLAIEGDLVTFEAPSVDLGDPDTTSRSLFETLRVRFHDSSVHQEVVAWMPQFSTIVPMAHRVAIPVYDGLGAYEYAITVELFGLHRPELDHVAYELVSCRVEQGAVRTSHGLSVEPRGTLEDVEAADTVIVAAWRDTTEIPPKPLLDSLRTAQANGARIAAICTGAFVLAHAGLLDDQTVTTHWLHAQTFAQTFPHITLDSSPLYIINKSGTLATSAGSSAGLDLCLALIADDHGTETATAIANRMVISQHRPGNQAQYTVPTAVSTSETHALADILQWVEATLARPHSIDDLAKRAHLSRRTFIRRFRQTTGLSPHAWLTNRRVHQARLLLETTDLSIDHIARKTGLGTAANFRKHMKRTTGLTPTQYRSNHPRP